MVSIRPLNVFMILTEARCGLIPSHKSDDDGSLRDDDLDPYPLRRHSRPSLPPTPFSLATAYAGVEEALRSRVFFAFAGPKAFLSMVEVYEERIVFLFEFWVTVISEV